MKKGEGFLFLLVAIILIGFVSAITISDDLHLNIQTINSTGSVVSGTYAFVFNISSSSNCTDVASVVYTNSSSLTTDSRGIISYYLPNVTLEYDSQYWLCHYRDSELQDTTKIAKTPYAFRAMNINSSGINFNSSLNATGFNITDSRNGLNFSRIVVDEGLYSADSKAPEISLGLSNTTYFYGSSETHLTH